MTAYVEEQGIDAFFCRPSWREELTAVFNSWPTEELGSFETSAEAELAALRELVESKRILEKTLENKKIHHFCYPWFVGSDIADRLAAEAGYHTLHYGPDLGGSKVQTEGGPLRMRRILEEYIFRLPGEGQLPLYSIWMDRVRSSMYKRTTGNMRT
jgi:hypothetical protein